MKKFILILIAFLSISTAAFGSDCFECQNEWINDTIIESYSPCTFLIAYKYRECVRPVNDTIREMELVSVNFFGDCNYSGSTDLVVSLATKFVLNQAYRVFNTLTDHSLNKEVTFGMPCCWQSDINNDYVSPCSGGDCMCCAIFDLRREKDAVGREYYTYVYQRTNNSPGQSTAGCGQGCDFMCDILDYITPGTPLPPNDNIPCQEECDDPSKWYQSSGQTKIKPVPGTSLCTISISYMYRSCDDYVEFNFTSFEYSGTDCDDDELLWNEAIEGVLADLASIYIDSLPKEFRFNFSTCWKRETLSLLPPDERTVFMPCSFDNCCIASYYIRNTGSGPKIVTPTEYHLDTLTAFYSCGIDTNCIFVCSDDFAELPYNHILTKKALIIEGNIFETTSEVVPNPTNDKVEFFIESLFNGEVEFNILDNTGKVIYTKVGVIDNGKVNFEFSSKSLPSAVYYFNVKAGKHIIESGKFIKQ